MLSFISWIGFLTTISCLVIIYYFLVAVLYYRTEILGLFKSKSGKQTTLVQGDEPFSQSMLHNDVVTSPRKPDSVANGKIHELTADLKGLLETAAKTKTIKEELIMALQMLLRDYSDLRDLPITAEINQYIKTDCQNICSITLSDAEMKMLWNG